MKRYLYSLPHVITLIGLACAGLAAVAVVEGRFDSAARLSLLVLPSRSLLADDGTCSLDQLLLGQHSNHRY